MQFFLTPSRWNIRHETQINASKKDVWAALVDINDWEWNKWTKLEAKEVAEGISGKLHASYEGDDNWKTFDFTFGKVSQDSLNWYGKIGPNGIIFSGNHVMQIETSSQDPNITTLIHYENFGGLLPALGLGLPYKLLKRNYLLMNEALKHYVENKGNNSKD